ncbi:MAG: hypothetical protein ACI8RY_001985, partial [Urechidicola sp.]
MDANAVYNIAHDVIFPLVRLHMCLDVRLLPEKGKASFINEAAANTVYDIHAAQNYLSTF